MVTLQTCFCFTCCAPVQPFACVSLCLTSACSSAVSCSRLTCVLCQLTCIHHTSHPPCHSSNPCTSYVSIGSITKQLTEVKQHWKTDKQTISLYFQKSIHRSLMKHYLRKLPYTPILKPTGWLYDKMFSVTSLRAHRHIEIWILWIQLQFNHPRLTFKLSWEVFFMRYPCHIRCGRMTRHLVYAGKEFMCE